MNFGILVDLCFSISLTCSIFLNEMNFSSYIDNFFNVYDILVSKSLKYARFKLKPQLKMHWKVNI